jgi:hypothetical protein
MVTKVSVSTSIFCISWIFLGTIKKTVNRMYDKNRESAAKRLFAPVPMQEEESEVWRFKRREYMKVRKAKVEESVE